MKMTLSALAMVAVAAAAMSQPAQARDGWSPGAAAAVGVLGGLAAGSAIAGSVQDPYYPGKPVGVAAPPPPPPGYYAPPPRRVYVEEDVGPSCYVRRRRYVNEFGDLVIRRERICD